MSNNKTLRYAILCAVLGAPSPLLAADASGQAIAYTCAGCHGTNGVSQGSAPSLAGEKAENLKEMLLDYKNDKEEGTIMNRIAKGYSDAELAAVAEFFSEQEQ
ncbi:MAG: c-type cytochrome [Gammaproteobacteria bacterium]|jgi:sulfide dehydrogenase cytochrome subunit